MQRPMKSGLFSNSFSFLGISVFLLFAVVFRVFPLGLQTASGLYTLPEQNLQKAAYHLGSVFWSKWRVLQPSLPASQVAASTRLNSLAVVFVTVFVTSGWSHALAKPLGMSSPVKKSSLSQKHSFSQIEVYPAVSHGILSTISHRTLVMLFVMFSFLHTSRCIPIVHVVANVIGISSSPGLLFNLVVSPFHSCFRVREAHGKNTLPFL